MSTKVSNLPVAADLATDQDFMVVEGGVSKQLSSNDILAYFIEEAPIDGDIYVRRNDAWEIQGTFIEDAPSDGDLYARKDGAWEIVDLKTKTLVSKSSDYSITTNDIDGVDEYMILIDGTANTVTISLLPASSVPSDVAIVLKSVNSSFLVDIATDGSEEIDGDSNNFELTTHGVIRIQSDLSNYWII